MHHPRIEVVLKKKCQAVSRRRPDVHDHDDPLRVRCRQVQLLDDFFSDFFVLFFFQFFSNPQSIFSFH